MGLVSNLIINRSNIPASSLSTASSSASSIVKIKLETPISAIDLKNRASAIHSLCFPVLSKTTHKAPCRIMFHILKDWLCYSSEDIHNKSNELKELVSERLRQSPQGDAARFEFVESIIKSETNQSVIIRQRCLSPNDTQFKPIKTMDLTTGKEFVIHEELSTTNCRQSVGIKVELNGNGIDSFQTHLKSLAERTEMRIFELGIYKDNDAHSAMLIHDDSNTYIVDLTIEQGVFSDIKNYLKAKNDDFNSLGDSLILNILPETIFADISQSTTSSGRLKRPHTDIVDLESNSTSDTQSQTSIADTDEESSVIDSGNHQPKSHKFSWEANCNLYKQFKEIHSREPKKRDQFEGVNLGSWVIVQRLAYKAGKLSQEKTDQLNVLGFVWDPLEFNWQANYELYHNFKKQNNREPKQTEQFEGLNLGDWVSHQRDFYKKGKLEESKIDLLNKVGFVWDPFESEWQTNYELYIQYKKINNGELKDKEEFEGVKLGFWVSRQRQLHKKGKLEESKIDLLNKVGFVWDPLESEWQTNYEKYTQFKQQYNREPKKGEQFEGLNLGDWVATQRRNYKKDILEESRLDLLNKAGFVWDPIEEKWQANYDLYQNFKTLNNREPKDKEQFEGENLRSWTNELRKLYKKGELEEGKIDLLNKVGFVWDLWEFKWQTNCNLYKQFKEIHNREPKKGEQFEGLNLGDWVSHQRDFYKKGKLEESKIDLLNKVGFVWDKDELSWQTNYELYKQFKELNNREPKEKEQVEDFKLGIWCSRQRQLYKKGKLEESRIDLLNKAGFVWSIRY